MMPPNLSKLSPPNLLTKVKHVISRWIAILIMEDGGCRLTFVKMTNPNVIKVATKSSCITHPLKLALAIISLIKSKKVGDQLSEPIKLDSST